MRYKSLYEKAIAFHKFATKDYTTHVIHYPDGPKHYGRVMNPETGRWKKSPEFNTKLQAEKWCQKFDHDRNSADFDWDQYQGKKPKPMSSKKIDPYTGLPIEIKQKLPEEEKTQPQLPAVPSTPHNKPDPYSIMNALYRKLDGFSSPRRVNVDLDRSMLITTQMVDEDGSKRLLRDIALNTIVPQLGPISFLGPTGDRFLWNINGNIDNVDTTHAIRVVARITDYPSEIRIIVLFNHDFYKKP